VYNNNTPEWWTSGMADPGMAGRYRQNDNCNNNNSNNRRDSSNLI